MDTLTLKLTTLNLLYKGVPEPLGPKGGLYTTVWVHIKINWLRINHCYSSKNGGPISIEMGVCEIISENLGVLDMKRFE